jgi:hypothetical protein
MALGISFGKSGQKSTQTTDINKTETQNQVQNGTQQTQGTTTNTGSTTSSGSTNTQQNTSQTGATTNTGKTTGTTQQTSSMFDSDVLSGLNSLVTTLMGHAATASQPISNFDKNAFISGGMAKATADSNANVEDAINGLVSGIGGRVDGNSMSALLAQRVHNDATANLAGVESTLTGQAEEIARTNALAGSQMDATNQNFLVNVLQALKGGSSTTTGAESQTQQQQGTSTQAGTNTGSETTSQQQNTTQQQVQNIMETLQQILNGTTTTVGTEATKGSISKTGGGFGLSL